MCMSSLRRIFSGLRSLKWVRGTCRHTWEKQMLRKAAKDDGNIFMDETNRKSYLCIIPLLCKYSRAQTISAEQNLVQVSSNEPILRMYFRSSPFLAQLRPKSEKSQLRNTLITTNKLLGTIWYINIYICHALINQTLKRIHNFSSS